jgi:hypothetical protein
MSTCVFYIDEAGSPEGHHVPIKEGETPIFTLAALAFPLDEWRERDRSFLSLKRKFFPDYLGKTEKRAEEYEIKGNELTAPRSISSTRKQEFNKKTLKYIADHRGVGFGVTFLKNCSHPTSSMSMYTQALQILVERFSNFISDSSDYKNAILICDSRMKGMKEKGLDISVARSHMSYIFGNETGRQFTNILEAPLFADSRLTVGLQLVDIFASNLFTSQYCYNHLGEIPGGEDYSHVSKYWPLIKNLQFQSKQQVNGYTLFGYKTIDFREER